MVRAVVQRVTEASVSVDGDVVGAIGSGLLILIGAAATDTSADVDALADKLIGLRIFRDEADRMNRSIVDAGGSALVVSQFTLLADVKRGRRPSFTRAAQPDRAEALVADFSAALRGRGLEVEEGRFGAMMDVQLVNDGPVTIVIDTEGGRVV
jgi:D-tyrosyl-tRNA(Tyr) deacylase